MDPQMDLRRKRLRLQASQRGLLEVELVLRSFVERHLAELSPSQIEAFELLLELADLDLWEVLCGRRPPPPQVDQALLELLRAPLARPERP